MKIVVDFLMVCVGGNEYNPVGPYQKEYEVVSSITLFQVEP